MWECAQGCWEEAALIGVYGLVRLRLVSAFHQRDTRALLKALAPGSSSPLCLLWLLVPAEQASVLVNGSFLSAFLAKCFCTAIMVAVTYPVACSVPDALPGTLCASRSKLASLTLCFPSRRKVWLPKCGWVSWFHTSDTSQSWGFCWIFLPLRPPLCACLSLSTLPRFSGMCPCPFAKWLHSSPHGRL